MIKKILLPVDGSDNSKKAIEHVAELAEKFNSAVIIVNAYELPSEVTGLQGGYTYTYSYLGDIERNLREYGEQVVNEARTILEKRGLKPSTLILKGHIGAAIIDIAKSEECDFIIMGRRGLGSFKSFLLGSVSDYVVHNAKSPVLVIH